MLSAALMLRHLGEADAAEMVARVAEGLGVPAGQVLVAVYAIILISLVLDLGIIMKQFKLAEA